MKVQILLTVALLLACVAGELSVLDFWWLAVLLMLLAAVCGWKVVEIVRRQMRDEFEDALAASFIGGDHG